MNLKKLPVCGLVLALAGIFFAIPSQAQEKEIIQVKTNIIQPVSVEFLHSGNGVVKGRVSGVVRTPNIEKITFIIKNYPQYDEIWREYIQWDDTFVQEGRIDIPFQFDVSKITIAERFVLATEFINEKGNLVASGSAGIQIPKNFVEVSTNLIENVTLDVGSNVKVSFLYVNGSKTQKVKPELRLIEHAVGGDEIFVLDNEEAVEMVPNEEKEFTLSFSIPKNPENYIVAVRVVDSKKNPVTGYVRDNFFVEGDFAEIKSIRILPDRAVEAGETVEVIVSGVVDNERGALEMNMEAFLDPKNEEADSLQEARMFVAEGDEFTESFLFTAPISTKKISVEVKISRDGNIIEEKTNNYVAEKESASFLIEIPEQVIEKYGDGGFEVWMIIIFALAMIVLLMSMLHRKKRMNILFLLIVPFLGMSTANAWQADWYFPELGMVFNPQTNSTEQTQGFETIVFRGSVYDPVSVNGYFEGELVSVDVTLAKSGTTIPVSIFIDDVTIHHDVQYDFDLDLSTVNNLLTDGEWAVSITFNGAISTEPVMIKIDKIAPEIEFDYASNDFTNEEVAVSIDCTDMGADCLQEGDHWYAPFDLNVLGNFSGTYNLNKIRGFEVCDQVANCTSSELIIDFYDPVKPTLTGMSIKRSGGPTLSGVEGDTMAADDEITLSLLGAIDPGEGIFQEDLHACGNNLNNDTYLAEDVEISFTAIPEVSGTFPGMYVERFKDGSPEEKAFAFLPKNEGSSTNYSAVGTIVSESEYQFRLKMIVGREEYVTSAIIDMGASSWSETLGDGTDYKTEIIGFTAATIEPNTQRCTPKFFVCAVNHPEGRSGPLREGMTEFLDSGDTCADRKGANWELLPQNFPFIFPFILEPPA